MKAKSNLKKTVSDLELFELGERIVFATLSTAIDQGEIQAKGKSPVELRKDLLGFLERYRGASNINIRMVLDHRETIAKEARRLNRNEEFFLSCLLYATWFEHWVNGLISNLARRKRLSQEMIVQIIRDTPFRGKLTWIIHLFELPAINPTHKKRILRIMDMRNSFVHFKHNFVDMDYHEENIEGPVRQTLRDIEKTISYLKRYEQRQLASIGERKIKRIMKVPPSNRAPLNT